MFVSERDLNGTVAEDESERRDAPETAGHPRVRRRTELTTIRLMGLELAALSELETIDHVLTELSHRRGGWLCTANLDILRQWNRSPDVRELVAATDVVVADGMPLVWASVLQGTPLPGRVAGSTLTLKLTASAAEAGASVFLIGGNPGVAEEAARRLGELNSGLKVAGTICPPFGFEEDVNAIREIADALKIAEPDIVYVGLGFPKQERLISHLAAQMPHTWFIGCGVSFSFIAGEFARAPGLVQRLGLEWVYRLVQEPRRLWRRYLLAGIPFFFELLASALANR